MNTPTIDQIYKHASIRRYTTEPVPKEMVATVVAAGQRGSTSSNLQVYSVVAVTDPGTRAKLTEFCGNQAFISQAPVFLAWCADLSRLARVSAARDLSIVTHTVESFLVSAVDVAITMQTAALAAESLGLGMCYIGAIRNDPQAVIDLLKLPRLVFPLVGMTLGWPEGPALIRPRLPLETILHWETYDPAGENLALAAYDRAMIETGIYKGRQVPVPGQDGDLEDYSWQEHSARRVAREVRIGLKDVIASQGFALD